MKHPFRTHRVGLVYLLPCVFSLIAHSFLTSATAMANPQSDSIFDIEVKTIDGEAVSMQDYKGLVLLIVNTASRCGFTSQYKGLEELYQNYKDQGLRVLGFPSNDFMGQEPGSDAEIKKFCELNFGITFPMFAKGPVTGENKQPLFRYLTEKETSTKPGEVRWNFEKFLVDRNGKLRGRFRSITGPSSKKLKKQLEELLNEPMGSSEAL